MRSSRAKIKQNKTNETLQLSKKNGRVLQDERQGYYITGHGAWENFRNPPLPA